MYIGQSVGLSLDGPSSCWFFGWLVSWSLYSLVGLLLHWSVPRSVHCPLVGLSLGWLVCFVGPSVVPYSLFGPSVCTLVKSVFQLVRSSFIYRSILVCCLVVSWSVGLSVYWSLPWSASPLVRSLVLSSLMVSWSVP